VLFRSKADQDFYLFSSHFDYLDNVTVIDEYQLYTNKIYELNRLIVVFSKTPFDKPILGHQELKDRPDLILPKTTNSVSFLKWLNNLRLKNEDIQVKNFDLTIKGRKQ